MSRRKVSSLVVGLGLMLLLSACQSPTVDDLEGFVLDRPNTKPSFVLDDTSGQPYDFVERTEGKLALLYFGYTRCPDICPVHLFQIQQTLRNNSRLAANTEVVFVSTDPEHDSPEVLRAYLDNFNSDFVGLTASNDELLALGDIFGLTLAVPDHVKEALDIDPIASHPAFIIAFSPDGLNYAIYPFGITQAQWDNDLPILNRFR